MSSKELTQSTPASALSPAPLENSLQSYLDAANDLVFAIDTAGQICYINAYGAQQLEAAAEDLSGQSLLDLIPPRFRLQSQQMVVRLLTKGALQNQTLRLRTA
ncbi:MAG: PAS domain-containing protein [Leptolyngbyaceae cyanobacterium SM1_1_3]|nr:PAS domain-containing protein [Leptolyngbyaceae cyanobacterium SM1_1_3]